jgi:hypothetical protein
VVDVIPSLLFPEEKFRHRKVLKNLPKFARPGSQSTKTQVKAYG